MSHRRSRQWTAMVLLAALMFVSACTKSSGAIETPIKPAKVEKVDGITRVTLTQEAAKRLDIATTAVREEGEGAALRKTIPYSAVLYDPQGQAWTFTNPSTLTYIREKITVELVKGQTAYLLAGPAIGVAVVTVGAAELYGAELGVGK